MLFPTHLAAGYVLGRRAGRPTPWVVAGAALPDAVDKSLATAGVVDLYHTVGHSAAALTLLLAVALFVRRGESTALAVGVASHLALDAGHVVLNGRPADAAFLAWPLARPPEPLALPPLAFVRVYVGTPSFLLECLFWCVLVSAVLTARLRTGRPV